MQLSIHDSYEEMSAKAAEALIRLTEEKKDPLVCIPSGHTPVLFCKFLVDHFKEKGSGPDWYFIGLDEWLGAGAADQGSCRQFVDEHFFKPLGIPENRICFFDGLAKDYKAEQFKAEQFIQQHGGIDVAVLGLGANGHLGFNEPGTDPELLTQVVDLDELTVSGGARYFGKEIQLQKGITLGLKAIMEAGTVLLLVNGEHKRDIFRTMLEGEINNEIPASFLRQHPDCWVYLDKAAAGDIAEK